MTAWITIADALPVLQPMDPSDPYLQVALDAATAMAIDFIQTDLSQQVTTEIYDGTESDRMLLRRGPINGVSAVTMTSGMPGPGLVLAPVPIPAQNIGFDDKFLVLNGYVFWKGRRNISVTYDAGYALVPTPGYQTIPQGVKTALIYTAKAIYSAQVFDFNTSGENAMGAYAAQYLVQTLGAMPPVAQALLQPYVRRAVW